MIFLMFVLVLVLAATTLAVLAAYHLGIRMGWIPGPLDELHATPTEVPVAIQSSLLIDVVNSGLDFESIGYRPYSTLFAAKDFFSSTTTNLRTSAMEALVAEAKKFDRVSSLIVDARLPSDSSGLMLLRAMRQSAAHTPPNVIILRMKTQDRFSASTKKFERLEVAHG